MFRLNIITKISIGLLSVYVVMLFLAIYLSLQLQLVSNQTRILYEYPYQVSNSIKDIQTKIYEYANLGIDIHFANSQSQLNRLKAETDKKDNYILKGFKIVSRKYPGNKTSVDNALAAYIDWKITFNKLYDIQQENKTDSKYTRILLESSKRLKKTDHFLTIISDFAKNKAESSYQKVIATNYNSNFTSIILIIFASLLVIFFIFFILKSNSQQIKNLVKETNILLKKKGKIQDIGDETLLIQTLDELKNAYLIIEEHDRVINNFNRQLSEMNIELDKKVKHRTNELSKANQELMLQNVINEKRAKELLVANEELALQNEEKEKWTDELLNANEELSFQNEEKEKRAQELLISVEEHRKTNEYLENLINYSNAPIIVWNTNYEIIKFNRAFENMTGRSEKEVLGKSLEIIFSKSQKEKSMELIMKSLIGRGLEFVEINVVHIDGSVHILQWNSANILSMDGETTVSTIAQCLDITLRKSIEAELLKMNETLEQKVTDRTEQLKESNTELESFCYSISHDLRAPLRHIVGFINLLIKNNSAVLDETGTRYLNIISESSVEMGSMIDALLNFSRLGRTAISRTKFSSRELVNTALETFQDELTGRKVEILISELPDANGDKFLIYQVWINLISNALKYSKKKDLAIIEIGGEIVNNETIFQIKDNGVGFDMKYADKLFGVFQRLHKARDFEGIGIGLANINRIVTKHGGRCWAESEVDKGATFFFSLPLGD